jgi:hypothetical protein
MIVKWFVAVVVVVKEEHKLPWRIAEPSIVLYCTVL